MNPKKSVIVFVLAAFGAFVVFVGSSAMRQGWFAPHESFTIDFPSGDGLSEGTSVSMSGLKAGRVTSVDLSENNHVTVKISVQRKFALRMREDSKATIGRPFIIGEKAISISPGALDKPLLKPDSKIIGEESLEITDLLSGGRIGPYFQTFSKLLDQLRVVIEGDGGPQNKNLVEVYGQAYRSLKSIEVMAHELETIRRDFATTPEMKKLVKDAAKSTESLQQLVAQLNSTMPAVTKVSVEAVSLMPQLSKTLNETTFTLQAMQRSFVLSGGVSSLKKEQAEEAKRAPASVTP